MKQMILLMNFLNLFLDNYQKEEQVMRKGSDFTFESIYLSDYLLHKISLKRRKSYIEYPEWLRNERATINPQNNDDKFFSVCNNCCLKSSKHWKQSRKNIKI